MNRPINKLISQAMIVFSCFPTIAANNSSLDAKSPKKQDNAKVKPNVLFISVDDMRDWVGYLNGYKGKIHTPNIDRLASQGVGFTNAHVAAPQSGPSRNAIMSGKRPSTTGLYDNDVWMKAAYPEMVTLPQYFKNNGYYTAGAGKVFHHTPGNNPPVNWNDFQDQVVDDPWVWNSWSPEKYFLDYGYRDKRPETPSWKPLNGIETFGAELDWGAIPGKDESDYGDVKVLEYLKKFLTRKTDQPFFLALGIYRPHIPWHVPQKYFDMYPLDKIVLPEVIENDLDDLPEEAKKVAGKRHKDFVTIRDRNKWKEAVQAYLASISFADALVGKLLDTFDKSRYSDNTIIVLWSDHGFHLGSKETWHKFTLWEDVTRIPFVIKAPGMKANGRLCHQPVDMLNVYPTLISLCGLPQKSDLDGHDMSVLLKNPEAEWQWPAITEYMPGQVAVRTRDWRYIRYQKGGEELYDRKKDPNEWHNLAKNPEYSTILEQHRKQATQKFAKTVVERTAWYFDPHNFTYLHRETGQFVDGKK